VILYKIKIICLYKLYTYQTHKYKHRNYLLFISSRYHTYAYFYFLSSINLLSLYPLLSIFLLLLNISIKFTKLQKMRKWTNTFFIPLTFDTNIILHSEQLHHTLETSIKDLWHFIQGLFLELVTELMYLSLRPHSHTL
jgi:hypothetical protein